MYGNAYHHQIQNKNKYNSVVGDDGSREDGEEQMQTYFGQLLGYGKKQLQQEPRSLEFERDSCKKQLEESYVSNYRVHLDADERIQQLREKLEECQSCVETMNARVPHLQEVSDGFRQRVHRNNSRRTSLRNVYGQQSSILDLLEIPSLMDTCVRGGNYEEALELKSFGKKLRMVHGDLPVVVMITHEIDKVSEVMLEQLLEKLEGTIQLAECLKVIGYVRRLGVYSEVGLKRQFLKRRGVLIDASLENTESLGPYEYLKKITDIHRLLMFDIVMQYQAIFSKDDEDYLQFGDPLFGWSHAQMEWYIAEIRLGVPKLQDGGSLASVFDHCVYAGVALGRVGLDFRPLIIPIFEEAMLNIFRELVSVSHDVFAEMLSTHRWITLASTVSRASEASRKQKNEKLNAETGETSTQEDTLEPPIVLIEHQPLAVYTNGILAAFNELRQFAPFTIQRLVAKSLSESFDVIANALRELEPSINEGSEERQVFIKSCNLTRSVMLPFLVECYSRLYGSPRNPILTDTILSKIPG